MIHYYLLSYDISSNAISQKMRSLLNTYPCDRVQKSVYICRCSVTQVAILWEQINQIHDEKSGTCRVLLLPLGSGVTGSLRSLGYDYDIGVHFDKECFAFF